MAIYDCFTFYDELQLLEIRLKLLYDYVDYFVLVEIPKTHRGVDKPLLFDKNKARYSQYLDKVIQVKVNYIPDYTHDGDWTIENWQRNCIMKGLANCKPDDIIMISDIDEIPNPIILKHFDETYAIPKLRYKFKRKIIRIMGYAEHNQIKMALKKNKVKDLIEFTPIVCEQSLFYYYLNCMAGIKWYGTVMVKYKSMEMPQNLRNIKDWLPVINDGGWHFSYVGGINKVKSKLKSIIDSNKEIIEKMKRYSDEEEFILECMANGKDIYGRKDIKFQFVRPDEIGIENIDEIVSGYPELFFDAKGER